MEDYQTMPETVAVSSEKSSRAAKPVRKKAAARKRQTTRTGARGKKPAPARKRKKNGGTRSMPGKPKGKPAGGRIR